MRLTVCIPSRGRPFMLEAAVLSLHRHASGTHEITYVVGCDADDPMTIAMGHMLRLRGVPVEVRCAQRGPSLGAMVNEICAAYPADVYCSLCDDVMALTQDWDEVIHSAWRATPDGVWWWRTKSGSHYAIVSLKWHAAAGRIFTDYFPFWWDDVWLVQIGKYVTGEPQKHIEAWLEDSAPATQRMRDLAFWTDFYWSRTSERRDEANRIRQKLGRPAFKIERHHELHRNADYTRRIDEIQAGQGERAPPTPEYLRAKDRAFALMNERKAA